MKRVAELGFNNLNHADVCLVLAVLAQQRGEGENEAAKVHIAEHEGQSSKMSGRKERERERERLCLHKQFFSLQDALQCIFRNLADRLAE